MNNYKKIYYLVALKNDDNYDQDFSIKTKAIKYANDLLKQGLKDIEIHIYKGEEDDERAIYIRTISFEKGVKIL
jgi:hypothetical protein